MANRVSPADDSSRSRPQSKQRVRTGCWPCRRRHRKCDERRPTCDNCLSRGSSCQYPATFIFASVQQAPPVETSEPSVQQREFTLKFVNGGSFDHLQGSSPEASPFTWQPTHTDVQPYEPDEPSNTFVFDDGSFDQERSLLVESCHTGSAASLDQPPRRTSYQSPAGVSPPVESRPESNTLLLAAPSDQFSPTTDRAVSSEMSLLRYYRYQVSPLLDVGDPWCSFSVKVPILARSEAPIKHAILALAARQRTLRTQNSTTRHEDDIFSIQQEIDRILLPEDDPVWHVRQSLLLFRDFSCLRPDQWRAFVMQSRSFQEIVNSVPTQQDLTNSAFWLLVKMDVAASLMCRTPLSITLPLASNLSIPCEGDRRALLRYMYLSSVILLAKVLDLIYTHPGKPRSEHFQTLTDSVPQEYPLLSDSWISLWHQCQDWYRDRPLEMQPTMSMNILEATRISHNESRHLPILIFSLPSAVVANIAYHTACFFLMIRKPRLCQVADDGNQVASSTKHIQCIAGIATRNNYPSQWEPILIASLFRSARKLTHESQHEAVLQVLQKMTAATGICLEKEVQELRDIQRASQKEQL